MLTRRLHEDDEEILPPRRTAEREMTLGTGAILGIFFGVVLSWGAFFGFGYKLGSSTTKSLSNTDGTQPVAAATSPNFGSFKPSAGSPVATGNGAAGTAPGIAVHDNGGAAMAAPPAGTASVSRQSGTAPAAVSGGSDEPAPSVHAAAPPVPAVLPPSTPPVSASGAFIVQVAAVSHQEDADLLVNALHAKGYAVTARSEPGDKLVHIQVGPFRDRKDAEAMKAKLSSDGYNAYIK